MQSFTDATGRKIVSVSTAETVGKVHDFVVDPTARAVIALEVKKADDGDTLLWSDLTAFGDDAVTVSGADKIVKAPEAVAAFTGKAHRLVGKRALSTLGDEIGTVTDVDFDDGSGAVTGIEIDSGTRRPGEDLVGVGSYAVVIKAG